MTYTGHMQNGQVVFDGPVPPEGTAVRVVVAPVPPEPPKGTLLDALRNVVGKATELPVDAASNVDHYLYGAAKR